MSIRNKEKILAKTTERPDPREKAPNIKQAIIKLHEKLSTKVRKNDISLDPML